MTQEKPLASGFGFDKEAVDAAKDLSGSWGRANAQKVFAILASWKTVYKGPRRLFFGLSSSAKRAFSRPAPAVLPKSRHSNEPFID